MARSADQLPRGRHGIPREEVLASQRGRMLWAMADAVAQRGYVKVTVADVLRGAGVSRETFYEHFKDKEDCFLAALEGAAQLLTGEVRDAVGAVASPAEGLEAMLGAYLDTMAREPAAARTFLIEVYGAGQRAIDRRVEMNARFVELVAAFAPEVERVRVEALVGAVSSMVTMRLASGRHESLPELREPLAALGLELLKL
jgi:AcrR family transcriptional regulator